MAVRVEPLTGSGLIEALPALARLRIEVFRDWPYLYDGSLSYEKDYLAKFAASSDALIVFARDGDTIVGASTGSPMTGHAGAFASAFRTHGLDPDAVYYLGESVLLPAYRGQGIGHAFFDHREARARRHGRFSCTAFCAVVRPADHPARPLGYRGLDAFWTKRGYSKITGLLADFAWKDIDRAVPDAKPMQFWSRPL